MKDNFSRLLLGLTPLILILSQVSHAAPGPGTGGVDKIPLLDIYLGADPAVLEIKIVSPAEAAEILRIQALTDPDETDQLELAYLTGGAEARNRSSGKKKRGRGVGYLPVRAEPRNCTATAGNASVYWEDSKTATGERFRAGGLTVASRTMRFNSIVKITNPRNGRSVNARVNDAGPYVAGRDIDLSRGVSNAIGFGGLGKVSVQMVSCGSGGGRGHKRSHKKA
jgi:rare lipoprotein A (peptidoglycan hydrolase)